MKKQWVLNASYWPDLAGQEVAYIPMCAFFNKDDHFYDITVCSISKVEYFRLIFK